MSFPSRPRGAGLTLAVTLLVVLAVLPAPAAAAARGGGTVVVAADETTGDLEAFGGNVVIRGTVDGDLEAFAGNVQILGDVTGDVETASGNVVVSGTVGGNVSAAGGAVHLTRNGSVGGSFEAGAEMVTVDGRIGGSARIGARQVVLGPTATIEGDLDHSDQLRRAPGATVGGTVVKNPDLEIDGASLPSIPGIAFTVFFLVVNLLLGAILLLVFPGFSRSLVDRTVDRPGVTGLAGLGLLVGAPVGLAVLAITIVGIPFALAGAGLYLLALWLGSVYGRYVLGAWLLARIDREHRWAALVLGVVLLAVLAQIPVVGGFLELAVLVGGLGALALGIYTAYHRRRGGQAGEASGTGNDPGATAAD